MKFYGVGVKFGGVDDMLPLFLEKNCWFMGWDSQEKERMAKLIAEIHVGDILIAKSYGSISQHTYPIEAIGIVTDTKLPDDIPEKYQNKSGVSVIWIKRFENKLHLLAKEYRRGQFHTATIFNESNDAMISKIKEIMKYDYIEGSEETEPDHAACVIPDDEYIEIAKIFVLEDAYSAYNEDEVFEYPDEEIAIKAQDPYGRKIICVPFEAEEMTVYGLVLLVPEKDWEDGSMGLANRCIMFSEDETNLSELMEEMKAQTDWNTSL